MTAAALLLALCLPALAGESQPEGAVPSGLTDTKLLFDAGKYSQVIDALSPENMKKLKGKKRLRLATLYLAQSYERTRQLDRALSVFQLGAKLFPKDVELLTGLARLYHSAKLEEQARPLFNRILKLEPGNINAHLGLAEIDRALGFLARSADHYETALERVPDNADVWRDYAEVLYQEKEYKTAELAIGKSLALSPQVLDSNIDLAYIQRGAGRLDEALSTLEGVLKVTGRQSDLLLNHALWLLEAGKPEAALKEAQETLAAAPGNALAHWICARANLSSGKKQAAAGHLRSAIADSPDGSFIARASGALLQTLP